MTDLFERLEAILDCDTRISERAAILFDTQPKAAYRWRKVGAPETVLRLIEFMELVPLEFWPMAMRDRAVKAHALGKRKGPQSTTPAARSADRQPRRRRSTEGEKVTEAKSKRKEGAGV